MPAGTKQSTSLTTKGHQLQVVDSLILNNEEENRMRCKNMKKSLLFAIALYYYYQ